MKYFNIQDKNGRYTGLIAERSPQMQEMRALEAEGMVRLETARIIVRASVLTTSDMMELNAWREKMARIKSETEAMRLDQFSAEQLEQALADGAFVYVPLAGGEISDINRLYEARKFNLMDNL